MIPDDPTSPQSSAPDVSQPPAAKPWFTADEIPMPPPEMRKPPGEEEPTLFDFIDEDDSRSSA
jgi:hypothetical protein